MRSPQDVPHIVWGPGSFFADADAPPPATECPEPSGKSASIYVSWQGVVRPSGDLALPAPQGGGIADRRRNGSSSLYSPSVVPVETARENGVTCEIKPARSAEDLGKAARLFAEYAASLSVDLSYQGFEQELKSLPGVYAPPGGDLLLALDRRGVTLGCVALRASSRLGCAEMKQLYLRPSSRGAGVGRGLVEAAIQTAKCLGYRELRLDTLPSMTTAMRLYAAMGFEVIEAYYAPTPAGTVFMSLNLQP